MKVSTKIIAGYALLVLLLGATIGYQVLLVRRVEQINSALSTVNFEAALVALRLDGGLREVEELLSKYLLLGDPGYHALLEATESRLEQDLDDIRGVVRSDSERDIVEGLGESWHNFLENVRQVESTAPAGTHAVLPISVAERLRHMHVQVDTLHSTIRLAIQSEVELSTRISERAERVSYIAAVVGMLVAGLVGFLNVTSISRGLHRLTAGTRSIAAGNFSYRIPDDRHDEFGELATKFNHMAGRLAELDQLKKDFVSSVSHELKSPIASSRELVQLMLDEVPGPLSSDQRRLLELTLRNSRRLSAMVGDLLDLARIDAGTMTCDLRPNDLVGLIQSTVEEFEAVLSERGFSLKAELPGEPVFVECDGDRIVQVLSNLLDNATKFAPSDSQVLVRLHVTDCSDSLREVQLSVEDAGPGVPDQHKTRIFGKFQQVHPGKRNLGPGVGLGLAICQAIIERHGGKIWVVDRPGGGSIFSFSFRSPVCGPDSSLVERNPVNADKLRDSDGKKYQVTPSGSGRTDARRM